MVKFRTGVITVCSRVPRNWIIKNSKPTQKHIWTCENLIWGDSKSWKGIINKLQWKASFWKLKVPHICSPPVHYRVQKSPPFVHILNRMNPVYATPSSCFKILFNTILPSTPRSADSFLSFVFPHQLLHTHKLLNLIKLRCSHNGGYEDVNLLGCGAACPEDWCSRFDLNVGKYLPKYTAVHSTGQQT